MPAMADAEHRYWVERHSLVVRITHWVNVACLFFLLLSGLQIFNAHPALYWGEASDFNNPILEIGVEFADQRGDSYKGVTRLFGKAYDTTGFLGMSKNSEGQYQAAAFPSWATIPDYRSLAFGRLWHFFFAWLFVLNGLVYLVSGFLSGHFRHDLLPRLGQWKRIFHSILDHLRFRFPRGDEARHYTILQQLAYLAIVFIVLPGMVLAGLAMSPAMNALMPWLSELFGGRQSARTVHFVLANLLVLFVLVHVFMVIVSGLWNNLRSMITGNYKVGDASDAKAK